MRGFRGTFSVTVLVLGAGLLGAAVDEKGEGRLKPVEAVPRDDLDGVVGVQISPDGKFVYAASWKAASATTFARDPETGKLKHTQTVNDNDTLAGTTTLALGRDGRSALAVAFQSRTAVLFQRNPENGQIVMSDVARDGSKDVRLGMPIDAAFSPDGKFVYVVDDRSPDGNSGALVAFWVNADKLELVGTDAGKDSCYTGARGIAFHPDGKTAFVVANDANTLVSVDRDESTGKTSVRQVVKDEENGVHGLAGAMGVVVSPDGRFVYVSAGRFQGDNAVSTFRLGSDGKLSLVQEILNGEGELRGFEGGNHLDISPDGLNLYVSATRSRSVACFRRDPETGKLRVLETLPDGGDATENGAAGIGVSPDGRFVYVATEDGKALSVFRRDMGK
jgi:6-phosphogluconolactonase (cycloisomerase 2 family)